MQKAILFILPCFTLLVMHVSPDDNITRIINYGIDHGILYDKRSSELTIQCLGFPLSQVSEMRGRLEIHLNVKKLVLYNCRPSNTPYADSLTQLNIEVTEHLTIYVPDEPPLNAIHFKGLPITKLTLGLPREECQDKTSTLLPSSDFLEPLVTLSELEVSNIILPRLPDKTRISKVTLSNGYSSNDFGECSELKELDVTVWYLLMKGWLRNCTKLTTLRIKSTSIHIIKRILIETRYIRSLTIRESKDLRALKDKTNCLNLFNHCPKLESLDLSFNSIQSLDLAKNTASNIDTKGRKRSGLGGTLNLFGEDRIIKIELHFRSVFKHLQSLIDLDLSNNELTSSWDFVLNLGYLQNLTTLTLNQNKLEQWCTIFISGIKLPQNLKRLNLVVIGATELCGVHMIGKHLEFLNMHSNNIETLRFDKLLEPKGRLVPFTIDLRNNPLREFQLTKEYYDDLKNLLSTNLAIMMDPTEIECDCEHKWLAKTARDCPRVNISGLRCNNGHTLVDVPLASIDCEKKKCSIRTGCEYKEWTNGTVDAHCSTPGPLPKFPNLRKLNVSGIGIKKLSPEDFPVSLEYIDLSKNHLSHIPAEVASAMFAVPQRVVRLAGNSLTCDCSNQALIAALQAHRNQIEDYEDVMCAGDEQSVGEVAVKHLCDMENQQTKLKTAMATSGGLAIVLIAVLVLHQRYKRQIRVFLHARGWCLCLFHEEDDRRPFDIFLSFSHLDEQLVVEDLLPKLEEDPYAYKVCVHYRDWIAGEWIPMQIARSVELSRRTLVVVSSSFLDSMWGLLEFRTAMMSSARDGIPRVVIVLLDTELVRDDRIDPELRAYLTTNTYLCWGDPWFWDKLYYALPHRKRRNNRQSSPMSPNSTRSSTVELTQLYVRNSTE